MLSNVLREVLLWIMHTVKFYAQWHRFHMRRHGLELPLDIKDECRLEGTPRLDDCHFHGAYGAALVRYLTPFV